MTTLKYNDKYDVRIYNEHNLKDLVIENCDVVYIMACSSEMINIINCKNVMILNLGTVENMNVIDSDITSIDLYEIDHLDVKRSKCTLNNPLMVHDFHFDEYSKDKLTLVHCSKYPNGKLIDSE
jgi:hypothetical protein